MNSGLMSVLYNYPEISIDYPDDFFQYNSWLLSRHKGYTLHPTTIKVRTTQLDGGSNYHVFTVITILTYIRTVKSIVQIINGIKAPAKGFGLVIIIMYKTSLYHSSHHIIWRKTHKKQPVKLYSNITINS